MTFAIPSIPSARAAPYDKSMIRLFHGPRSLIRTYTDRRLRRLVTLAHEPSGSVRDAAVRAYMSYLSPLAVSLP